MIKKFEEYTDKSILNIKELSGSFSDIKDFESELKKRLVNKIVTFFYYEGVESKVYRAKSRVSDVEVDSPSEVYIIIEEDVSEWELKLNISKPIIVHEMENDMVKYNL